MRLRILLIFLTVGLPMSAAAAMAGEPVHL